MKAKDQTEGQPQVATSAVVCDGAECKECGGNGGITRRHPAPHVGTYHVECPYCKGTGRVASRSHTDKVSDR